MNTVPVRTADFEWNLGFNFTKQESRLVELVEGIDRIGVGNAGSLTQQTFVGGIIGDLYSTSVLRVESGEYEGWPILNNNGGLTFQTDNALKPKVGKSTNDFNVGMNTSVKYKNFTLSANLDWRQG
ncbi:MAG TPA: SusC/RagA family TonB-linked outer membrane protein, partial [Arenibacter sp.]|nr:SusC/RagA family TonB-linked outer membrane protein [Arenibacter sp.]